MNLTETDRQAFAEALLQAERTRNFIEPLSSTHPAADIEDAYDIARRVTALKVAAGRRVVGQKVGLTSKAMRSTFEATEPDFGTLFDDWFVDEGSRIAAERLNLPMVEIELAFVMAAPLRGAVTAVDVIRATDFVVPAIEIVDRRFTRRGDNGLIDSVADAASCGLVVIGANPVRLVDIDVRLVGGSMYLNGELEESGVAAAVMGNPVNSVAWLVRKLAEFGVGLEEGHCVLSGSFVRARSIGAGDTVVADFGELGQISFGVTEPVAA